MGQSNSAQQQEGRNDGVTWWCKLFARSASLIASLVAFTCGIWTIVTLTPLCIVGGVWQILIAMLVFILEGAWCCQCWPFLEKVSQFAERRQYWQKGILYVTCSIFTVVLCRSLSVWLGSGLLFAGGVIYGLVALGKKADKEDMISEAQKLQGDSSDVKLMLSDSRGLD